MATKLEKCAAAVNDQFSDKLKAAFNTKFNREITTRFDIFAMVLISEPVDGEPYTEEQKAWVEAYDAGYTDAMEVVREMAMG